MEDTDFFGEAEETEEQDSNDLSKVRKWGRGWEKTAKAATKERDELKDQVAQIQEQLRQRDLKDAAREKNVSDEQLALLEKIAPNAKAEDLDAFLEALGPRDATESASEEEPTQKPAPSVTPSFRPIQGDTGGTIGKKVYNDEVINEIFRTRNEQKLRSMVQEIQAGRAELDLKWEHYIPDEFDFGE